VQFKNKKIPKVLPTLELFFRNVSWVSKHFSPICLVVV